MNTVLPTVGAVSQNSLKQSLRAGGFTIERIRTDRILHEALTAGPDPLHLSLVFGISHITARRPGRTGTKQHPSKSRAVTGT